MGQHQALAEPLLPQIRSLHRRLTTGKNNPASISVRPEQTAEMWRLLGSLELLPLNTKIELGQIILDLLPKWKMGPVRPAMIWAWGRLASRVPLYGPLNGVVPPETVTQWVMELLDLAETEPVDQLALMQAARRTDDRYRDLPEKLRQQVATWLESTSAPTHHQQLVTAGGKLDHEEQSQIFGEALPCGLELL